MPGEQRPPENQTTWGREWKAAAGQERIDSALHTSDSDRALFVSGEVPPARLAQIFHSIYAKTWRDEALTAVRHAAGNRSIVDAPANGNERPSLWARIRDAWRSPETPPVDPRRDAPPVLKVVEGHGTTKRLWYPSAGDTYGMLTSWLTISPARASPEAAPLPDASFYLPKALTGLKMEGPMRVFYLPRVVEGGTIGYVLSIEVLDGAWAIEKPPKPPPPGTIENERGIHLPPAD